MDFEITKREILVSIIIVLLMTFFGFFIGTAISNDIAETNEYYYKALKINNDADMFNYGMESSVGDSLVQGIFNSVGTVSLPELSNQYWKIEKVTERYEKDIETYTTTDSKGRTQTKTRTVYEWNRVFADTESVSEFTFLNATFPASKIDLENEFRINLDENTVSSDYQKNIRWDYIYEEDKLFNSVGDLRFKYYAIPCEFTGTMLVKLKDNTMLNAINEKSTIDVYDNKTIQDVLDIREQSETTAIVVFWILWIVLTGGLIIGFYYIDNRWLE